MNPNKQQREDERDWRNEHGEPDYAYLQSLATDGSPAAIEKLQSIAGDMDVDFDEGASPEDLVELIRTAAEQNEDGDVAVTS